MPEYIKAKTILSKVKGTDTWFGLMYNMNLYRGCQHGCIYCDTRSDCYRVGDISHIRVKENALELLEKELKSKIVKGTVGFGSMNDPYMPLEAKEEITKKALLLCEKYRFPVHIITKGVLVERDIEILSRINAHNYAAVSMTITTADDNLARIIEPGAEVSSKRFAVIKKLADAGIYSGITLMPILPFINDTEENVREIVRMAAGAGARYIIPSFGVTLRDTQRLYFYNQLDKHFPGIKEKYIKYYGNSYGCNSPDYSKLYSVLKNECSKVNITTKMEKYEAPVNPLWKLF